MTVLLLITATAGAAPPAIFFENIAEKAGLEFVHEHGGGGEGHAGLAPRRRYRVWRAGPGTAVLEPGR